MLAPILSILLATSALAAPSQVAGCDASQKHMALPSGQTQLALPTTTVPSFVALGVGVQNYTCGSTSTFTYVRLGTFTTCVTHFSLNSNVGAVAELFDLSCAKDSSFGDLTDVAFAFWKVTPKDVTTQDIIKTLAFIDPAFKTPIILGQHYFVTNPTTGTGVSPKWDFTSASLKGHTDAFVVGARIGDLAAPTNPATNVDWLALNAAQGNLADEVFRVETRGGQPPSSVSFGS